MIFFNCRNIDIAASRRGHKLKVSDAALEKFNYTVRGLCRRTRGKSIYQIIGS